MRRRRHSASEHWPAAFDYAWPRTRAHKQNIYARQFLPHDADFSLVTRRPRLALLDDEFSLQHAFRQISPRLYTHFTMRACCRLPVMRRERCRWLIYLLRRGDAIAVRRA